MYLTCCFLLTASIATAYRGGCRLARPASGQPATIEKSCGISAVQPVLSSPTVHNLEGGYPAVPHSWPWVVSIQYKDFILGGDWKHWCAGVLVSPRLIITNGLCRNADSVLAKQSPFNWLVILQPHNNSVVANINTSVTIESFSSDFYQGDLTLSDDIVENDFIKTICVDEEISFPVGYVECFVADWFGQGTNLTQAQVMLVSLEQYQNETGHINETPDLVVYAVVISTSGFPSSFALGQPLMCRKWCNRDEGQWYLVGVAHDDYVKQGRYDNKIYIEFLKYVAKA